MNKNFVSLTSQDFEDIIGNVEGEAFGKVLEEMHRVLVIVQYGEPERRESSPLVIMSDVGKRNGVQFKFGANADHVQTVPELRSRFPYS